MTYYDLLEIKPDASPEIVRAAYKAQAKKYHPDSQSTGDTEHMKKINEAYEVLSDPERRAAYDRDLKERRAGTGQEGQTANNADGQSQAPGEAASQQPAPKKKRLGWYLSWPVLFIATLINIPVGIALTGWRCLKVFFRKDLYKRKRRAIGTAVYLLAFITFIYPIAKNMAESDGTVNTPPAQSTVQPSKDDTSPAQSTIQTSTDNTPPAQSTVQPDTSSGPQKEPVPTNKEIDSPSSSEPESKPPKTQTNTKNWNTPSNINDAPNLFEIGGTVYSIAGISKEFIQNTFPDAVDYEENGLLEASAKFMIHFDNHDAADSVFLLSETDSLYKNIRVGMTEAEIIEILGPTTSVDERGEKFWGYDINGNHTNDESRFAYLICPSYDENGKAQMMILSYYHQPISELILVSVEYKRGISDLSGKDAEIYLDDVYMVTIPSGDTRILMIPRDDKTHEITVKKYGFKTASTTFGPENYSSMDDRESCVGYKTNSSLGYMHIEETDFEYAMEEFFALYVVLIDGEPVELSNIESANWMNVFRDFAQQH
ncbi:DnaJ domain-containing protein [Oscillospiraceae bacterium 50-16]